MKHKINNKKSYIDFLKKLTHWLVSDPDKIILKELLEEHNITNTIFMRLMSYAYNYMHIIYFCNKYLNKNKILSETDTVELISNISLIFRNNFLLNSKSFYYLKSDRVKDFKPELKEYFSTLYDCDFNRDEIDYIYKLLNEQEINEITNKIQQSSKIIDSDIDYTIDKMSNFFKKSEFDLFKEQIKIDKQESVLCNQCELYHKTLVTFDTNLKTFGPVDVAFIGLNPGKEEKKHGKPFVESGASGKKLREQIERLPKNISWVIYNIILCYTNNSTEIKDSCKTMNYCNEMFIKIYNKFPTKLFVSLGKEASLKFGIDKQITKVSGELHNFNGYDVIPMTHPSWIRNKPERLQKFTEDFTGLINYLTNEPNIDNIKKEDSDIQTEHVNSNDESINNIVEERPNIDYKLNYIMDNDLKSGKYTFLDVKELQSNKLLNIYIDSNGKKYYQIKNNKMKIYLKNDNWKNNTITTDKVDKVLELTGYEKQQLLRALRTKIQKN